MVRLFYIVDMVFILYSHVIFFPLCWHAFVFREKGAIKKDNNSPILSEFLFETRLAARLVKMNAREGASRAIQH